jgi:hypothetical protein
MRYFLWIGYGAVLALLLWIGRPTKAPEGTGFVAAAPLEANRRIGNGDIVLAREPAYIRRSLRKGEPIRPDDVLSWPSAKPPAGKVAVALPTPAAGSGPGALLAGEEAALCPEPAGEPKRMKVVSVVCGARGEGCLALLAASPEQAEALAKEQNAGRATSAGRACGRSGT